ncbi:hypothetical protein G3I76_60025 [Streptomyces sp. SID11233]|uniref:hypothetical protein n=1 Tax=Streptomyces sp. SID11385 TaxID=2706031 RepID=UPI0013C13F77|nr:hypothetical protein [Streptomyces sp. SID11385]NEA41229.1 hypothetical protein [Streptomyces sp. SID11385]NED90153.1 hypothetical protein [Streptomyces sp. SID11233]
MPSPVTRFRDPRASKYAFLGSILVRCPGCDGVAHVTPQPRGDSGLFAKRRLVCRRCGRCREWSGRRCALPGGGPVRDPYFGLPLRLQARTRHGWVWAYNPAHLDLLRRFVAAGLRERPRPDGGTIRMTVVARLPAWMQKAKNRSEVLHALDRARAALLPDRRS